MADLIAYLENDNVVSLWVRDSISASDLSGGSATYTLKTQAATVTTGSLSYNTTGVSDSDTYYIYRVTLSNALSLSRYTRYFLDITFNGGAGKIAKWSNVPVTTRERTS